MAWAPARMAVPGAVGAREVERNVLRGVTVAVWREGDCWGWARGTSAGWQYGKAWSRKLAVRAALWS